MPGASGTMRAIVSERPGTARDLVLRDMPIPQPATDEVLVRVGACGLNYPDVLMIEDLYQRSFERPFSPGIEIAGIIEQVGRGVSGFRAGDRVVGLVDNGGLAGFVRARPELLYALHDNVDFQQAASILLTYGTSYHALRDRGGLKAGESLLVLGAGGGVGLAAVEIGKLMGARVVAAVSSEEKAAVARAVGADAVIIYPATIEDGRALGAQFKAACPAGYDVIYDPVGGTYSEPALRAIGWGGRFLVIGFPAGIARLPLNLTLLKGCAIVGVAWGAAVDRDPDAARAMVAELISLFAAGRLKSVPPDVRGLDEAVGALAALRSRQIVGKLVITP